MLNVFDKLFFNVSLGGEEYTVFPDQSPSNFSAIDSSGNSINDPELLGSLYLHVSAIDLADRLLSQGILEDQVAGLQNLVDSIINLYATDAAASALTQTVSAFTFTVYFSGGTAAVPLASTLSSIAVSSAASSAEAAANLGAPTILGLNAASNVQTAQDILSNISTNLSQGIALEAGDIQTLINSVLIANSMLLDATQIASEDELLNRGFLGDLGQFGLDLISPALSVIGATGLNNLVNPNLFEIAEKLSLAEDLAEIFLRPGITTNEILGDINDYYSDEFPQPYFSAESRLEAAIRFGLDGPTQSSGGQFVDSDGELAGTVNLSAPTFMGDGDVEYTVSLSGIGQGLQYNIAYIIDVSGSMGGKRIVDARDAYIELTNQLKALGIADVANFAVIPFNSGSTLYADLTADEAIARISSLGADGGTSFGPALSNAQTFFSSANTGQTNIAYFLSDGQGSGASDFLTNIANVQAFGIGSGANLSSLNIIDSDNAISLTSSSQLVDVLTGSGASVDEIDGIAISVDGNVVDFITPDQLVDGPLGLQYTGTISSLDTSPDAQNEVTATVFLKGVDGAKGSTTLSIASAFGDTTVTQSDDEARVILSAFDTIYNADDGGASNVNLLANNLNNEIIATNTGGTFSLYDGDDYFLSSQTAGSTIDRVIDGGDGYDVVEYLEEFVSGFAEKLSGFIKVGSNSDTLSNIEEIRFSNGTLLTDSFTFQIEGTDDSDNLTGTEGDDEIRSYAGRYDKMFGDIGADQFIFGAEADNGLRERDVILDYQVGIDEIVLEDGASVASVRETRSQVVIFLEDDRDAIYVRGDGVTADNITIIEDDVFQLI